VTLLADIGNSRLKWASAGPTGLAERGAVEYRSEGLARALETAWVRVKKPGRLVVSNVAGETAAAVLTGWSLGRWGVTPEFVVAREAACGVRNAYTEPARLGADRWAALVGAWSLHHQAVCVVDCGTAVTIDALSAQGEHLGGLILPGLVLMRRSLVEGTGGVRPVGDADVALLARNTAGAVAAGTLYALVAAVDRIAADIGAEIETTLEPVITGGDAALLLPLLAGRWTHHPDLVLQGLAVLAQEGAIPR
jgi:type III pantothenate kinase